MSTIKQEQESGDHSVNIQGRDISIVGGISYVEARQIAIDVFNANFEKLSKEAAEIANSRVDELVNGFLDELKLRSPNSLPAMRSPGMQYALFTAQKEYARTGDHDLADMLVDILVDRAAHTDRNLMQIVLDESLSVAPKLTAEQFDTLSLIFLVKYTKRIGMASHEMLKQYVSESLVPFISSLTREQSCYQHLEFAGCGSIGLGSTEIESIYKKTYPGLFCKGFTQEIVAKQIPEWDFSSDLMIPCLHDETKLQLNAIDESVIEQLAQKKGLSPELTTKLKSLHSQHLLTEKEIKDFLLKLDSRLSSLFEVWHDSAIKHMTLTSVGIAIAHANIRRKTKMTIDLSIWIK